MVDENGSTLAVNEPEGGGHAPQWRSNAGASDPAQLERPAGIGMSSNQGGWHPEEKDHRVKERRYWALTTAFAAVAAAGAIAAGITAHFGLWRDGEASRNQ